MKPGTVINQTKYRAELREVVKILISPRVERVDERLSEKLGGAVVREFFDIRPDAIKGVNGGRLAVAAGQHLLWHFKGLPTPKRPAHPADAFYGVFHLYWHLLGRKLTLDAETAADLVRIDLAGRGDTELRHALVKLVERNFEPPAPEPLAGALVEWGDELAVHRRALCRKLAARVYRLRDR